MASATGRPLRRISVVVFFGGWYLVRRFVLSDRERFLIPAPHDVWTRGFADSDARGEILSATLVTAKEAGAGLLIAIVLGVVSAR